jgi:molecular chaperone DnaK
MKIFVSYARVDKAHVQELVAILRAGGHEPWFDVHLLPGQDWKAILKREIARCDAFVYALTPASLASEWCQWEFAMAVNLGKPVIPVLLNRETKLPESIAKYHYADFSEGASPVVVAQLMGGLSYIAVTISVQDAPSAPIVPDGIPSRVSWTDQRYTLSQKYLKSNSSGKNQYISPVPESRGWEATIIGIDFGTTNSLCAVIENGHAIIIPNKFGYSYTPSAVGIELDGSILVGDAAVKFSLQNPERCVLEVKRLLGSDLVLEVDGITYTPTQLVSFVLDALRQDAEAFLDKKISRAVLAAPAYFSLTQITELKLAGEMIGLEVRRTIQEPIAACVSYGSHKQVNGNYAVYDLGGGTFDISILTVGDGVFEVRAVHGDNRLGGLDFDMNLVSYSVNYFKAHTSIDLSNNLIALMRIREAAEKAKIILSSAKMTSIYVPYIYGDLYGSYDLNVPLSREKFDELTYHLVEKTISYCQRAIEDAVLTIKDIDNLVLVGLATKTPSVREAVSKFFGLKPVRDAEPDQIVALGAAYQGGILYGDVKDILLLDVTPLGYSIEVFGGKAITMIEKNTTIPTRKYVIFTPYKDGQTEANIRLLEGDHEVAERNKLIANLILIGIQADTASQTEIEVNVDIDANSIVRLIAQNKQTGYKLSATIDRNFKQLFSSSMTSQNAIILKPKDENIEKK